MTRTSAKSRTIFSLSAVALLITGAVLYAGPLNPPAGPVAPTQKTLAEVEPRIAINATNTPGDVDSLFKITQPGSYYLAANITGVIGKHGVEIAASGVTLDLMGFDLVGVPGMGPFDGVSATVANLRNISLVNGSVRSWGAEGVDLPAINSRVDTIRVTSNGGNGINAGRSGTVSNCTAYQNSGNGINTSYGSTVSHCSASAHGGHGISTASGCTISDCSSDSNFGNGIFAGAGSTVSNCSVYQNTGPGIGTDINCAVTSCSASFNDADGIRVTNGCTVTHCSAFNNAQGISTGQGCTVSNCTTINNGNGFGIIIGPDSTVMNCTASRNGVSGISAGNACTVSNCTTNSNIGDGITTLDGCSITACTAADNSTRGINVNNGGQITGCMIRNNAWEGIRANFSCVVIGNNCNGDGAAAGTHGAITVIGQANRVEGNNISYADRGLYITSGGNVVVRNSVKGCTVNYDIVVGNDVGPIGTAATATSPWANIQY